MTGRHRTIALRPRPHLRRGAAQPHRRNRAPYFWTNRLWGGVVPWLFADGTNLLKESKAPGGAWLWDTFYPAADRQGRGGGYRWTAPQATVDRVEEAYVRDARRRPARPGA